MRRAASIALAAAALAAAAMAQEPSFSIDVRAPSPVRALLEQHLELRRYREVTDLDDDELARLIVLAERDVRDLVGTLGFFDPRIAIRREQGTNGKRLIVIEVEPGAITKVAGVKIDFEGDIAQTADRGAIIQREEIRSGWRLPVGNSFTQDDWDRAKSHALRLLVNRRYPAGKVSYSLADIDAPAGRAQLGLRLDSGPFFRLGAMQVRGVERYDPNLVPRLARLPAGSLYDQDAITRAQLRLSGSGYYDSAFIFVDPEDDPNAAGVQVTVREAPLQKVVLGLGVSTDTGARASIEHRHNRVPGIDWRAVTKLQIETKSPFAQTEWTAIPGEDGWRWGWLARAERMDDGELITDAQRLRWGRTWAGDHIDRNAYVQYDRATVEVVPGSTATPQDTGDGTSLSANFVWTGRYFDKTPFPSRGFGVGFELGAGYTLTGSKRPFQRTVFRWLGVQPLPQGSRLQLRTEAGAVLAPSDAQVPSTQLFRTGGDTTVRGYEYRDIGVRLPDGVIAPGRYMVIGSAEWQRPIRIDGVETNWESALFVDGGAVSNSVSELQPVFGAGVGARWKSPLGPLQVDLAYGFKTRDVRLHMNIGVIF